MVPIKETLQRINRRFFAHLKNVLKDGMDGVWRREKESCPGR
jgi:hypothetical protein